MAMDPLDQEILNLETLLSQESGEIAAIMEQINQKRRDLDMLALEARTLRRAATLRPTVPVSMAAPPAPEPVSAPPPLPQPTVAVARPRGMFGQIRTTDPRLPVLPGG